MTDLSRRAVAKGAAWSIPAVSISAAAPSLAASPCSTFIKGQPLPASAFAPGYFIVTNQTFGGVANKSISIAAGISLTADAAACVGSAAITNFALIATQNDGTMTLTNGRTYTVTGGAGIAGTGTVGKTNGGCSGPSGAVGQACNTYTGVGLANSTGTSSANPRSASITYTINVAGYGTSTVNLNVASFVQNGTSWDGVGVTFS